jgi:hypothetical protein
MCEQQNRAYDIRYAHAHPEWWREDGNEMFLAFVNAVRAEKANG